MMSSQEPQTGHIQIQTEPPPFWRDERVLRIAAQIISAIVVIGFLFLAVRNVLDAAAQRGLNLGFGFLSGAAGFPIGETDLAYTPEKSFAFAFLVGVVNTLKVSIVGIFLATILGTIVGVARLSTNWLVSRIALAFIEIHRNIPLLVLLYLWYSGVFIQLPRVKDSFVWPGPTYINQRGVYFTWPQLNANSPLFLILTGVGILLAIIAFFWLRRIRETTGRLTNFGIVSLVILFLFPLVGLVLTGFKPFDIETPVLQGFNFKGGLHLTPEFTALLIGLVTYTAAFIAEVVRAGIQAVSRGQLEAASALGLKSFQVLGLVIMPQALRIIIPPLISQYLNLTKNSSLAIFIGYPELFFMGKTTINQAGRAVQVFVLVVLVYLVMSLFTSLILNIYNRRIQLVER
jgi:general L-amino acid transport system permease protein